jgi:hypothetical protein
MSDTILKLETERIRREEDVSDFLCGVGRAQKSVGGNSGCTAIGP